MNTQQRIDMLSNIKNSIESMDKLNQVEVLRLLNKHSVVLNENKNGIHINLSELDEKTIEEMHKFVDYIYNQENKLTEEESKKQTYKNIFFDNKDNE